MSSAALSNSGNANRTYINTFQGMFTIKASEDTEGAITRKNKEGKIVHELHFNTLADVFVQDIERRENPEFGPNWDLYLMHEPTGECYVLNLPFSGRFTMGFFLRLPNIDLKQPITFQSYYFPEEKRSALVVYQFGKKIEAYWKQKVENGPSVSEEDGSELPQLEQVTYQGKEQWDATKRMNFIEAFMKKNVNHLLIGKPEGDTSGHTSVSKETESKPELETVKTDETNKPMFDEVAGEWKMKLDNGNFYKCDQDGKLMRDQHGNKIETLPF
jgi:hypothetical protein